MPGSYGDCEPPIERTNAAKAFYAVKARASWQSEEREDKPYVRLFFYGQDLQSMEVLKEALERAFSPTKLSRHTSFSINDLIGSGYARTARDNILMAFVDVSLDAFKSGDMREVTFPELVNDTARLYQIEKEGFVELHTSEGKCIHLETFKPIQLVQTQSGLFVRLKRLIAA